MSNISIECVYADTLNEMLTGYFGKPMYVLTYEGTWYCIKSGEEYTEKEFCDLARSILERRCKHEGTECDYYDGRRRNV